MEWFKKILNRKHKLEETISSSKTTDYVLDDQSRTEKINLLFENMHQNWKLYESSRDKSSRLHTLQFVFLELYDKLKVSFKMAKDKFRYMDSFIIESCKSVNRTYKELVDKVSLKVTSDEKAQSLYDYFKTHSHTLEVIHIFSQELPSLDILIKSKIPTYLVKIYIYLFELPIDQLEKDDKVVQTLVNILLRLCTNQNTVKQLMSNNILYDLFMIPFSYIKNHYLREESLPVISIIIKYGLNKDIILYISSKKYILTVCDILASKMSDFDVTFLCDAVLMLLCLLEESSKITNGSLLEEFENYQGYSLLTQFLLTIDVSDKLNNSERVINDIIDLMFTGMNEMNMEIDYDNKYCPVEKTIVLGETYYITLNNTQIKPTIINISDNSKRVKNVGPIRVILNYFLASNNNSLKEVVLDLIAKIYSLHEENYFLLQHLKVMPYIIESISYQNEKIRESIQRVLLFTATALNVIPFYELLSLTTVFEESILSGNFDVSSLCIESIRFLINYDHKYKSILTDANLFDSLLTLFKRYSKSYISNNSGFNLDILNNIEAYPINEGFDIIIEGLILFIKDSVLHINRLFEMKIECILSCILKNYDIRKSIIKLLGALIKENASKQAELFEYFMEFIYTSSNIDLIKESLYILNELLCDVPKMKELFRLYNGFKYISSILYHLENRLQDVSNDEYQYYSNIFETIFATLNNAISSLFLSRKSITEDIIAILYSGIKNTGILYSNSWNLISCLFKVAFESENDIIFDIAAIKNNPRKSGTLFKEKIPIIYNASFLSLLLDLLCDIKDLENRKELLLFFFRIIDELCQKVCNTESLSTSNILEVAQKRLQSDIENPNSELYAPLTKFIVCLGSQNISTQSMINLFDLFNPIKPTNFISHHLNTLYRMISTGCEQTAPFFYIDFSDPDMSGFKSCINNVTWPPTSGFTISFWVYFDQLSSDILKLIRIYGTKDASTLSVFLNEFQLYIQYNDNEKIHLESFNFGCKKWYHIVIIHEKRLLYQSETKVYVDGVHIVSKKENLSTSVNANLDIVVGTMDDFMMSELHPIWRLSSLYVFEQPLEKHDICILNSLGYSYSGHFYGPILEDLTFDCMNMRSILNMEELAGHLQQDINISQFKFSTAIHEKLIASICATKEFILANQNFASQLMHESTCIRANHDKDNERYGLITKEEFMEMKNKDKKITETAYQIIDQDFKTTLTSKINIKMLCWPSPLPFNMYRIHGIEALLYLFEFTSSLDNESNVIKNDISKDNSLSLVALQCILEYSKHIPHNLIEMIRKNGYAIISEILKKNIQIMTYDKIKLLFSFVGISNVGVQMSGENSSKLNIPSKDESNQYKVYTSTLSNIHAFKYFFLDFSVWKKWPIDLQISIFEYIRTLFVGNPCFIFNSYQLRKLNTFTTFLNILKDKDLRPELYPHITTFLGNLLSSSLNYSDLNALSGFILSTFSSKLSIRRDNSDTLRHLLVFVMYNVLIESEISLFCKCLDYQWIVTFFSTESNPKTIITMLKILCTLFKEKPSYLAKFIKSNGIKMLEISLSRFHNQVEIYYVLFCILFGKIPESSKDFNEFTSFEELFPKPEGEHYTVVCKHILLVILSLIRKNYIEYLQNSFKKKEGLIISSSSKKVDNKIISIRRKRSSSYVNRSPTQERSVYSSRQSIDLETSKTIGLRQPHLRKSSISVATATVGNVFRNAIKGKQKKTKHTSTIEVPLQVINKSSLGNKSYIRKVPCFLESHSLPNVRTNSNQKTSNYSLIMVKNLITFISQLFSHSQLSSSIKKYNFMQYIVGILFPNEYNLITNRDENFEIAVIDLISNILLDHVMMNSKENLLDEVLEISIPSTLSDHHYFNNLILGYSFKLISNSFDKVNQDFTKIMQSLSRFCNYCIDKILIGTFTNGVDVLLSFLSKQVEWIQKKNRSDFESVIKIINRVVIVAFIEIEQTTDSEEMINKLITILNYQKILFIPQNNDKEFYATLCYLLFSLLKHPDERINEFSSVLWKIMVKEKKEMVEWVLKKQTEIPIINNKLYTISFQSEKDMELMTWLHKQKITDVFEENIEKIKKSTINNEERISKDKLSILKKNAITAKNREEKNGLDSSNTIKNATIICQKLILKVEEEELSQYQQYINGWRDLNTYISKQWLNNRLSLFNDKQLWGPKDEHPLQKWKLDDTENALRMRFKLVRNFDFFKHYPYSLDSPTSKDSEIFSSLDDNEKELVDRNMYYANRVSKLHENEKILSQSPEISDKYIKIFEERLPKTKEDVSIDSDYEVDLVHSSSKTSLDTNSAIETNDSCISHDDFSSSDEADFDQDFETQDLLTLIEDTNLDQRLSRYLLPGDEPNYIVPSSKLDGLDKMDGLFLLCNLCVYFIQNVSMIGDIIVFNKPENHSIGTKDYHVTSWYYEDIEKVLKRRYLLRPVAIEIFSRDGRNSLLVFDIHERDIVFEKLEQSVQNSSTYKKDLTLNEYTDLWVHGHISNFGYLMLLNTFAGRSYNDLTQYPIFPWILKDYHSENLDLNNPEIYRDLSKPMGALGEERKQKFLERYESLDDDVPKFHYGSHYSSAAIVLHYMIRLEPFTQHSINLQGGKFDKPDRLFDSIEESWISSSQENMMDVKELIPEFFYLTEFLSNSNNFLFGKKQSGDIINDVVLPPWANNSPRKFISLHRKALESKYISENLHHWIDLIFGYKQRGQYAEQAMNLFYYLTYEGAVDIDSIEDETEKQAVIDQINNFGQTPTQLFKKPHPKKIVNFKPDVPLFSLDHESIIVTVIKKLNISIEHIYLPSGGDKVYFLTPNKLFLPSSNQRYVSWGYEDRCIRLWESNKLQLVYSNTYHPSGYVTCVATSKDGRILVTAGTDNIIRIHQLEWIKKPKLTCNQDIKLQGHISPIIRVAVSRHLSIVVSLDIEGNVFVWDLNSSSFLRSFYIESNSPKSTVFEKRGFIIIDSENGEIAVAKNRTFYIWSINGDVIGYRHFNNIITSLTSYPVSFDGNRHYVVGQENGTISVFELDLSSSKSNDADQNLSLINEFYMHNDPVTSLYYSPSHRIFYSGSHSGIFMKWEERPLKM